MTRGLAVLFCLITLTRQCYCVRVWVLIRTAMMRHFRTCSPCGYEARLMLGGTNRQSGLFGRNNASHLKLRSWHLFERSSIGQKRLLLVFGAVWGPHGNDYRYMVRRRSCRRFTVSAGYQWAGGGCGLVSGERQGENTRQWVKNLQTRQHRDL